MSVDIVGSREKHCIGNAQVADNGVLLDQYSLILTMTEMMIKQDIIELETKLSFHEHTIQELNDALMAQQDRISNLETVISILQKRLEVITPSITASESEETPPPHY